MINAFFLVVDLRVDRPHASCVTIILSNQKRGAIIEKMEIQRAITGEKTIMSSTLVLDNTKQSDVTGMCIIM